MTPTEPTATIIPFDQTKPPVPQVMCSFCKKPKKVGSGIIDNGNGQAICFGCVTICAKLMDAPEVSA